MAGLIQFVGGARQKPTTKVVRMEGTEEGRNKALQVVASAIRGWRACEKSGYWPKCSPDSFYCAPGVCGFYRNCYPKRVDSTFVKVGKISPVGSLPQAEWRNKE
jgi:hypothetical protein